MRLSVTDAAFEGFRIVRRRPAVVIWWTLAWFVSNVVSGLLLMAIAGPAATELLQAATTALESGQMPEPDPALAAAVAPAMLALAGWSLAFHAVFLSAVARAVLTPDASHLGYLRLGATELVQFANLLLWGAVLAAAYVGLLLAASLLGAIASIGGPAAGGFLAFVAMGAALAALVWIAARLSLAGPAVVATRKMGLGASWRRSAPVARPLFGASLLALAMAFVVWVLVSMIFAPLAAVAELGEATPDAASVAAWLNLRTLIAAAISAVAYALAGAIVGAYGARAWQVLSGGRETAGEP